MKYEFENSPEFHVWDLESYAEIDSVARFKNSWLSKFLTPGDAILDIGCGPGYIVKVLQDNGYKVMGVDLNEALVRKAKAQGLNVIKLDAVEAIETRGGEFNCFFMCDFVEHVPLAVVVQILKQIARKQNSKVYICTPNLDSLMGFKFWFHMPTHINAMHPNVIRKMLLGMGYEILDEWSEYGNLPGKGVKLKLRKWILQKLLGTQSQLFTGGANICFLAKSR